MQRSGQKSKMERKKMGSAGSLLQSGLQYLGAMPLFCWDRWDFAPGFRAATISLLMLFTHTWPCRQESHCNLECLKKYCVSHACWDQYEDSLYVSERQIYLLHLTIIKDRFFGIRSLCLQSRRKAGHVWIYPTCWLTAILFKAKTTPSNTFSHQQQLPTSKSR